MLIAQIEACEVCEIKIMRIINEINRKFAKASEEIESKKYLLVGYL